MHSHTHTHTQHTHRYILYIYMYMYISICIYVYVYIYIYMSKKVGLNKQNLMSDVLKGPTSTEFSVLVLITFLLKFLIFLD